MDADQMDVADVTPLLQFFGEQGLDVFDDGDGLEYQFRVDGVTIKYMDLKKEYMKYHKKIPNKQRNNGGRSKCSWMRVKDGQTNILIEAKGLPEGEIIARVVVQRERAAYAEARQMNDGDRKYICGEVNIDYECKQIEAGKWEFKLDLDSVYEAEENGILKEVYALCPSNIEGTNKFQLVTELYLRTPNGFGGHKDSLVGRKQSQPFLLRTEPRAGKSAVLPRTPESILDGSLENSPPRSALNEGSPQLNGTLDAFYDHLRANLADVGELRAHTIKASKGDIGYHIRLRDLSQKGQLDEGDVVGFFEDENHKTVIERYSKENYSRAKLAGVITRSYYLEGLCKEAIRGETDLVCIIGIVKVRVLGMVRNGEQLYAYKRRPGVAVTSARLGLDKQEEHEKPFLIGQALESRPDAEPDQESLVSAFVSIVNGIDCLAMNEKFADLNQQFKGMMRSLVMDATKKIKRRFFWLKLLLIVALATVALALWQRYAPNTLLRKSICKRGSLDEQTMELSYNTSWQEISITALEFDFKSLRAKLYNSRRFKRRSEELQQVKMRYFINLERCCNRGVSYGNDYVDNTPTVAGPEILSSDIKCTPESVKYFNDGKWRPLMNYKRQVVIKECYSHLE